MDNWNTVASDESIAKVVAALKENGIEAIVVNTKDEAKAKVLELIPEGSEVMAMTSITLDTIGITEELNNPEGKYISIRNKLNTLNRETDTQEMNKLGAAPQYAVGSVHAITEDGHIFIASNTGSQLPAYVYSALNVIWVVGAQKIVKNFDQAMKRLYEHTLPLESERAHKAYGVPGSFVSKLLIINKEVNPKRCKLILVKEELGF